MLGREYAKGFKLQERDKTKKVDPKEKKLYQFDNCICMQKRRMRNQQRKRIKFVLDLRVTDSAAMVIVEAGRALYGV